MKNRTQGKNYRRLSPAAHSIKKGRKLRGKKQEKRPERLKKHGFTQKPARPAPQSVNQPSERKKKSTQKRLKRKNHHYCPRVIQEKEMCTRVERKKNLQ